MFFPVYVSLEPFCDPAILNAEAGSTPNLTDLFDLLSFTSVDEMVDEQDLLQDKGISFTFVGYQELPQSTVQSPEIPRLPSLFSRYHVR